MAVNLMALALLAAFANRPYKEVSQTVPLTPEGRVYLRTFEGTVEVNGWSRPEVRIVARVESHGLLRTDAACVEETRLSVDAWPASVRITSAFAGVPETRPWWLAVVGGACNGRALVHYRLWIPRGAALTIVDEESRIRVTGVERVYLKTHVNTAGGGARQ